MDTPDPEGAGRGAYAQVTHRSPSATLTQYNVREVQSMKTVLWIAFVVSLLFAGYAGLSVFKVAGLVGAVAQAYTYLMWALVMGLFAMHHEK